MSVMRRKAAIIEGLQEWLNLAKSGHKDEGWKSEIFRQRFVLVHLIAVMGHTGVKIKKDGKVADNEW